MLLEKRMIQKLAIVQGARAEQYRDAGYDLAVGTIITREGKIVEGPSYILPPHGGMVEAISAETLKVPTDVLSYASTKTSVSRDAVLALNVGIIDPGYEGLISTTLVNFSKQPFVLHKGRPFLRLTFHRVRPRPDAKRSGSPNEEYVRKEVDKAVVHFAESFLDIEKTVEKTAEKAAGEVFEKYTKNLLLWFPLGLLALAAGTFIFNFVLPRYTVPPGGIDVRGSCQQVVEERLREFEKNLAAKTPPPTGPQPSGNAAP